MIIAFGELVLGDWLRLRAVNQGRIRIVANAYLDPMLTDHCSFRIAYHQFENIASVGFRDGVRARTRVQIAELADRLKSNAGAVKWLTVKCNSARDPRIVGRTAADDPKQETGN